ncbi:flagellar biosynthesis protein FlhF [Clostridium tertium]|jgi:flagellar biosynthesis protein FlhF|uniref:flagellar biosynthesis protein FlhF n=1 Tax=Clostridium TaxID=1485 RepID=UPI001157FE08|nr:MULTISPECIES: flagellar biosynthesis protein FlhF [Clostridium]MBS5305003.1 flagellar biosynthesis protein FlhF [Clostridium sp.]MDB1922534.1 flagellar biosynthesis protein FlhF [Clostridium tertium]MDB1926249.1 flagellar biosynthesis protein FlhF [Clostridium tertium]MDB1928891.1 flagellar biosynthesis protein FlhF [Clostridium tertium]MDB1932277.1 flagellar biosynthesis protein FlhF [Clostridium tertium]
MLIKKYLVKNMNEALTRIRYELGKDAIIISQRKVRESGIKGYFKPKLIEVTAALENNKMEKKNKFNIENKNEIDFKDSLDSIKKIIDDSKDSKLDKSQKFNKEVNLTNTDNIKEEVKEIKDLLNRVIKNTNKEEEKDIVLEYLKDIDIDDELIKEILTDKYDNIDVFKTYFKELLENEIQVCTESLSGKVVLVGPTGVGKTTTIAKLAGRLALIEKKKVGLITIDTYRIGAVEQLKTYAEIMNIPFKVVITLKEMENAVSELEDCDVILIDTTGRSSKNTMQISELRAFTQKVNADHIALVISGTTKNRDIQTIINGYSEIGYEKMIITKLDETSSYGCIYNIIKKAQKPIAYITTGQNVPDDIRIPLKSEISKLILGEETIC